MNIVDPILFQCHRQPPVAAICAPGPGIGLISYRRLEKFVHNITRKLHALGLPARSVVGVNIQDVIFHVAVLLALTRLGMITVSTREGEALLPIRTDALITDSKIALDNVQVIPADLGWTEGDGRPLEPDLLPQINEDDACRLILTSGTTGAPRAVAVSHKLLANRMARHSSVFGNRLGKLLPDLQRRSGVVFARLSVPHLHFVARRNSVFSPGKILRAPCPCSKIIKFNVWSDPPAVSKICFVGSMLFMHIKAISRCCCAPVMCCRDRCRIDCVRESARISLRSTARPKPACPLPRMHTRSPTSRGLSGS